jgi:hypothetical protein
MSGHAGALLRIAGCIAGGTAFIKGDLVMGPIYYFLKPINLIFGEP